MNIRKANEIFGYGYFIVGALKIILLILLLFQLVTNISAISSGNDVQESYEIFSLIIGFAQIFLAFGSIIMIIVNRKKEHEVISGYLCGLGAMLIEFIVPPIMLIFYSIVECGMYMKAGSKIINKTWEYKGDYKKNKELINNTEWFYSDKKEPNKQNEQKEVKNLKRTTKLEEEIYEWKKLLNSGEIDEETYTYETNRLIEKEKRKKERKKF